MDIQDLRYFVAVTQTLNITKAADRLFITRQALSKAICKLEKECGSDLFLRSSGNLQMTPLGRDLLEKSIPILDSFDGIEKSFDISSKNKNSKIRIAIGLGTMNGLPLRLFTNFALAYPEIKFSIIEVCDDEVRKNLDAEEVDIGILNSAPEKLDEYDFKLLKPGKISVQISKDNPLSTIKLMKPEDLNHQPFVSLGERCDMHNVLMEKCYKVNSFPNLILETIDSNVANNMVYNDIAISLAIESNYSVTNSAVRVIPLDLGDIAWGVYVISRKGFEYTGSVRLLFDYLVNFTN
jgi:DNA-binding transcriptional LysR family regulator